MRPQKYKKIIAVVLILSFLSISAPRFAYADAWGTNASSALLKQALEELYLKIKETIIANLKIMAIQTIQSRLSQLIGSSGPGGGSLVISNWQTFIYSSAQKYSMQVTNDFFSKMKSGLPGPMVTRIVNPAQKMATVSPTSIRPDLQNYVQNGDASKIFVQGFAPDKWAAFRRSFMPQNDPAYLAAVGVDLQQESSRQKEGAKTAEGVAGKGYESVKEKSQAGGNEAGKYGEVGYSSENEGHEETTESYGFGEDPLAGMSQEEIENITVPGSTVADTTVKGKTLSMDMLTLARSIPEIATSMVTTMLTQMMNQGIAMVSSKISSQLGSFGGGIGSTFSATATSVGGTTIKTTTTKLQNMIQSGLK